jgi:hypothetical protein
MIEEALVYHSAMVKVFLVMLFVNLVIPFLFKSNSVKAIKMTRMSYFLFSALLAMVAFTGMILFMLMDAPWSMGMTGMVVVFVLLSAVEIIRSRKLREAWLRGENGIAVSWRYVLIEIAMASAMIIAAIWEKKDAVPL